MKISGKSMWEKIKTYMKTAFWLYVKMSSSTNVVFDSCEMEFCDRKLANN